MIYYIDLFCGAGGVSTGIVRAGGKVIACINHDEIAIKSHKANHKSVLHFTEDIRHFNVHILARLVKSIRKNDPNAVICLWASLECTHFSKAKGGESRNADSRTLAEFLFKYIEAICPDYIDIENVVEFMSWGPLRIAYRCDLKLVKSKKTKEKQGHPYHMIPKSRKNGIYYQRWLTHICEAYDYYYDYRILNAADFGARTSRVRYFGQFKKAYLPFTWPEATHSKNPEKLNGGIGRKLRKWKPVKPALELDDKGESIFGRKKDLVENTLKRIYAGLIKHVGEGKESELLMKYYGNGSTHSLNRPSDTLTTKDRMALVWLDKQYSGSDNHQNIDQPAGTILTNDKHSLITAINKSEFYLMNPQYANKGQKLDKPCFTLIARMDKKPPYLIEAERSINTVSVVAGDDDSETVKKIKAFMALHGIVDIKMRMLNVSELLKIQGFGVGYKLYGNQTDQKKFIGNSVPPELVKCKVKARIERLSEGLSLNQNVA